MAAPNAFRWELDVGLFLGGFDRDGFSATPNTDTRDAHARVHNFVYMEVNKETRTEKLGKLCVFIGKVNKNRGGNGRVVHAGGSR